MNIFGFFGDAIQGIISTFLGQTGLLGDLVMKPLQGLIQQVVGGAWKGQGADKFVETMNQTLKQLANLGQSNDNFAQGIQKAVQQMEGAFGQATNVVNSLQDIIGGIF